MLNQIKKETFALVALGCLVLLAGLQLAQVSSEAAGKKQARQIAITFDELPAAETFGEVDRVAINNMILESLKKHEVKATGFVIGQNIGDSFDLLGTWLNDGHKLGNLTYSHQDYNELGIESFLKDIAMGEQTLEPMLSGFGQKKRYFRFPYLHYGNNAESKRQARLFLDNRNYVVAHATVVVEDYLYNLSFVQLKSKADTGAFEQLRSEFINHVLEELEAVEIVAQQDMNRRVSHILQLRCNRLNAEFLDGLLGAIKDMGYTFITLDKALKDKLYSKPEAYFGMRGVGYLDMIRNSDPDHLPAE